MNTPLNQDSPTPRVDELMTKVAFGQPCCAINANFARQLEREVNVLEATLKDTLAYLLAWLPDWNKCHNQHIRINFIKEALREVERMRSNE